MKTVVSVERAVGAFSRFLCKSFYVSETQKRRLLRSLRSEQEAADPIGAPSSALRKPRAQRDGGVGSVQGSTHD
jgi:hypothetical protein